MNSSHYAHAPRIGLRHTRTSGFTLVEMIVSLGIFSIVATVSLGALVKIVSANKKAQTLQSSITNLNFALDAMSRELRTGRSFRCEPGSSYGYKGDAMTGTDCPGGNPLQNSENAVIAFRSSKRITTGPNAPCSAAYAYRFEKLDPSGDIYDLQKAVQTSCDTGITSDDFQSIIDPNVGIDGFYITVTDDPYQLATIRISGSAGLREREKTYFDVQTTVSTRVSE